MSKVVEVAEIPADMATGEYIQDGQSVAVIVIPLNHEATKVTEKGNCTLGNVRENMVLEGRDGKTFTFQGLVYRWDRK